MFGGLKCDRLGIVIEYGGILCGGIGGFRLSGSCLDLCARILLYQGLAHCIIRSVRVVMGFIRFSPIPLHQGVVYFFLSKTINPTPQK